MASINTKSLNWLGLGIVLLHLLMVLPHGMAHSNLHIDMSRWQNVYIILVINVMPLLAAILLWKSARLGHLLLFLSMTGSLVFGVYYHFIAAGADNIATLPQHPWSPTFAWTAVLLAITELAGAVIGAIGFRKA